MAGALRRLLSVGGLEVVGERQVALPAPAAPCGRARSPSPPRRCRCAGCSAAMRRGRSSTGTRRARSPGAPRSGPARTACRGRRRPRRGRSRTPIPGGVRLVEVDVALDVGDVEAAQHRRLRLSASASEWGSLRPGLGLRGRRLREREPRLRADHAVRHEVAGIAGRRARPCPCPCRSRRRGQHEVAERVQPPLQTPDARCLSDAAGALAQHRAALVGARGRAGRSPPSYSRCHHSHFASQ